MPDGLADSLVETIRESLLVLDPEFRVLKANAAFFRTFRATPEATLGRSLFTLGNGQWDIPELRRLLETLLPARNPFHDFEVRHEFEQIGARTMLLNARRVDREGVPELILLAIEDVSDRRFAETEKDRLAAVGADLSVIVGVEGRFVWVSAGWQDFLGWTFEEMTSRPWLEFVHPEDREITSSEDGRLRDGADTHRFENRYLARDGSYRWVRWKARTFDDPERVYAGAYDVTEQKRAEEELRTQLRLTRAITDNATLGLFIMDENQHCTFMNPAAERLTGYTLDEVRGRPLHDAVHHTHPDGTPYPLADCPIDRAFPENNQEQGEEVFVSRDGSFYPVAFTASPIRVDQSVIGTIIEVQGIRERKEIERTLREDRETLETLNRLGRTLASEFDTERLIQATTDAATDLTHAAFGAFFYNQEDERGGSYMLYSLSGAPREAFESFPLPRATDLFGPTFRNEGTVRCDDVTSDPRFTAMPLGHLPVRSYLAVSVVGRSGQVLGGLFFGHPEPGVFDERAARLAEGIASHAAVGFENARLYEQLRRGEEQFRILADSIDQMVWVTRPDGYHTYFNRRWYDYTGVPEGSTDGEGWNGLFHPEDRPRAQERWIRSLESGEPYEIEYRLRRLDGEYRWVLGRALPQRSEEGQILRWFGTCTDIHDQRRANEERERLLREAEAGRKEAEAANRMKDQFLATLSHELRTPLTAIVGWARILLSGKVDADDIQEGLQVIDRNAKAQAQLIEDLLDISRIMSGNLRLDVQRVNLAEIIDSALTTVAPAAEAKEVRLRKVLDSLAAPVTGDPTRLQQIVWNLLSNAVKFTPRGGQVQVLLERVNSHVEISVIDTGMGIRPEFLPYVFDRFRQADATTTRRYGGLGLGLSIVKQLVEMHGGSVRVKSPGEGLGATFVVCLPILVVHEATVPAGPAHTPARSEPEPDCAADPLEGVKVLVVDDEADARALVKRVLSDCGADVRVASSVPEALSLIDKFRPHILVSDVGMPDEDGYDLIRQVRAGGRSSRRMPAVALTAFARGEDRTRAMRAGFQSHVAKPVDPTELVAVVASLAGKTG